MRSMMPEQYRQRTGPWASSISYGANGAFIIPHHRITGYFYVCMVSDQQGWEHVSVSLLSKKRMVDRCPTWEEMCHVKSIFWDDHEEVMQLHPRSSDHVNVHPYCLHLWKPIGQEIPMPPAIMVGPPINIDKK